MFQYTPYILPLLISAIISFALGVYAWQYRARTAALSFAALMLASFTWFFAATLEVVSVDLNVRLFWANISFIGITVMPVAWLALVLSYTGRTRRLKQVIPIFLVIPVITNLLIWSNDFHHLWRGHSALDTSSAPFPLTVYDYGLWFYWVHIPFSLFVFLFSSVLLIRSLAFATPVYRRQILTLLFSLALPLTVDILYTFGITLLPNLNLTPVVFSMAGIVIGWDLFRYRFLDLTPMARDRVVESMNDGVIVLDAQSRIVDMNPAAQKLMRRSLIDVVGQPLEPLLLKWPDLAARFRDVQEAHTQIVLDEEAEPRYYELHLSPLYGRQKKMIGRLIVLHDITEYKGLEEIQERYAAQNAQLFQEEQRQRKIVEGLRQAMLALSRSLDHTAIVAEILAQIKQLIPYDSAGFFLQDGDDLRLSNGVGFDYAVVDARIPLNSRNRTVQAFKHKQIEVIPDVRADPHWHPFSTAEKVHSAMAAPLVIGQEAIGVLTVDRFEPQAFTEEDAQILQVFADQAAIAFRNAQLHRQAQTAAALEERHRLAQDLHDAVNQTLFSAALIAEALPDIWEEDPGHGAQVLEELRLLTQGALAEMRTLLLELRPAALTEKSFGELLQHLCKAFTNRARIPVELHIEGDRVFSPDVQVALYRIAQETLINIAKHANAAQVDLNFDCASGEVVLSICDNGRGFDISKIPVGHFGLTIMRERAEKIGATLEIASQPGRGANVSLTWKDES